MSDLMLDLRRVSMCPLPIHALISSLRVDLIRAMACTWDAVHMHQPFIAAARHDELLALDHLICLVHLAFSCAI